MPNVSFGSVHFVGRAIPEMNSGSLRLGGRLEGEARRSATAKVAHSQARVQPVRAGRLLVAKANRSAIQKWLKTCLAAATCGYFNFFKSKLNRCLFLKCCA